LLPKLKMSFFQLLHFETDRSIRQILADFNIPVFSLELVLGSGPRDDCPYHGNDEREVSSIMKIVGFRALELIGLGNPE
jgi:hypothetical protein